MRKKRKLPDPLAWRKGGLRPGIRPASEKQETHGAVKVLYSRDHPEDTGTLICANCMRRTKPLTDEQLERFASRHSTAVCSRCRKPLGDSAILKTLSSA